MAQDQFFFTGQLVWLKSGGPAMTVDLSLRSDGLIVAYWFSGTELKQEAFQPDCLVDRDPLHCLPADVLGPWPYSKPKVALL